MKIPQVLIRVRDSTPLATAKEESAAAGGRKVDQPCTRRFRRLRVDLNCGVYHGAGKVPLSTSKWVRAGPGVRSSLHIDTGLTAPLQLHYIAEMELNSDEIIDETPRSAKSCR